MSRHPAAARIARVLLGALFASMAASVLAVAAFRWLPVPTTAFMLAERQAGRAEGKPLDQQHEWVPWERISPHAAVAVIAAEDQKFPVHDGFDFQAIEKAVTDAQRGRRLRW